MELTVGWSVATGSVFLLIEVIAEAFAVVLLFGLLLFVCLVGSLVLLFTIGAILSVRGTVAGAAVAVVVLAVVTGATDLGVGLLAAIVAMGLTVAVGWRVWPGSLSVVEHPLYRLVLFSVGAVGVAAGLGLWAYLLSLGGFELLALALGGNPREAVNLVVVTGVPIGLGTVAIAMASRRRPVGDRGQPA